MYYDDILLKFYNNAFQVSLFLDKLLSARYCFTIILRSFSDYNVRLLLSLNLEKKTLCETRSEASNGSKANEKLDEKFIFVNFYSVTKFVGFCQCKIAQAKPSSTLKPLKFHWLSLS